MRKRIMLRLFTWMYNLSGGRINWLGIPAQEEDEKHLRIVVDGQTCERFILDTVNNSIRRAY